MNFTSRSPDSGDTVRICRILYRFLSLLTIPDEETYLLRAQRALVRFPRRRTVALQLSDSCKNRSRTFNIELCVSTGELSLETIMRCVCWAISFFNEKSSKWAALRFFFDDDSSSFEENSRSVKIVFFVKMQLLYFCTDSKHLWSFDCK